MQFRFPLDIKSRSQIIYNTITNFGPANAYQRRKQESRWILLLRRYQRANELRQISTVCSPWRRHNVRLEMVIWRPFLPFSMRYLYHLAALFHTESVLRIHFPFRLNRRKNEDNKLLSDVQNC